MTEVVVMLSFFVYLLSLKNIIALAPFHQEFELRYFQCQLKGPNKLSLNGFSYILDDLWVSNSVLKLFSNSAGGVSKGCGIYFDGKWACLNCLL
jgi:hypothetical protein